MLKQLIAAFDDDEGLNNDGFEFAVQFIQSLLGERAARVFANHIDGCDGRYFIKAPNTADSVYGDVIAIAGQDQ